MRGILMVECLYHQTIKGLKTQTRRSGGLDEVNGRKATKTKPAIETNPDEWELVRIDSVGSVKFCKKHDALSELWLFPRYRVGEVLFLKEPYIFLKDDTVSFWNGYAYQFGARPGTATSDKGCELGGPDFKFKNKLFMPAAAARAFIRITGIKCERLLNISDEDCVAEGIEKASVRVLDERFDGYKNYLRSKNGGVDMLHTCEYYPDMFPHRKDLSAKRDSFLSLYKFANKVKEVPNLWVFAYTFEYLPNYKPEAI